MDNIEQIKKELAKYRLLSNEDNVKNEIGKQIIELDKLLKVENYKDYQIDLQEGLNLIQEVLDEFDMRKIKRKLGIRD